MGGSKSSSATTNQDNRVASEGGGVAIGAGGSYVNEFSPEVASFAEKTLALLGQVATGTQTAVDKSLGVASELAKRTQVSPVANAQNDALASTTANIKAGAWPLAAVGVAVTYLLIRGRK